MAFLVSGVGIMFGFVPFRTCPLLAQMFVCPLSFFVCLVWLPTTFSLFLSLSGAGETQTHFGFGFPLVSLRPGHDLRPRSVHRPLHLPQGPAPAPVFFFFFFVAVRAGLWSVFGSRGGVSVRSVFWSGVLVGLGCSSFVLLHSCISSCIRATAMPVFRPQWRLTPFPPLIGSSWVTRLLLGVDPGTVRSAAGRGCRRHCDPAQFLGTTIIIMTALPGHRRPPPQQTPAISSVPGFVGGFLFFVCHATLSFRLHFLHLCLALGRQPYCHTLSRFLCLCFPLFEGGNAVRFFHFVFSVSGPVSFAVFCRSSFLRVAFWKNFRERTFVFGWLCWSCVFWWVFAIVFALFFGVSLPKLFGKILLMSGLVFSGFVLSSLGFSSSSSSFSVFFFQETQFR